MTETKVYISVADDQKKKHLTIDGDLALLGNLLTTLRNGEKPKRRDMVPTGDQADAATEHEVSDGR